MCLMPIIYSTMMIVCLIQCLNYFYYNDDIQYKYQIQMMKWNVPMKYKYDNDILIYTILAIQYNILNDDLQYNDW